MERIDLNKISKEELELSQKQMKLLYKFNHTEPLSEEYANEFVYLSVRNLSKPSEIQNKSFYFYFRGVAYL